MKTSFFRVGVLAVLVLAGCAEGVAEKEAVEVKEKLLVKEDEGMKLDITIPEVDGLEEFNQQAIKLGRDLEAEVRGSVLEDSPTSNVNLQADGHMDYKVKFVDDQTVSVLVESYLYGEGWAHGVTSLEPLNYDLRTESPIELADLFEGNNGMTDLYRLVDLEMENSGLKESLTRPFTEIKEDQQFYLTSDSVVLVFDQYEITAGYESPQEIIIAKSELKNLKDSFK